MGGAGFILWRHFIGYNMIEPTLVGGLEHFIFFHLLGIIIPTDELIFF
jgi:hypothetical protein